MVRRTKILATLGPASSSPEAIAALIAAGADAFRLNFSHGERKVHEAAVANVRHVSARVGKPVAVVQDISGPKIRVGKLPGGGLDLVVGQEVRFAAGEEAQGDVVPITYDSLARDVKAGNTILMDDGYLGAEVLAVEGRTVLARVTVGGRLKSNKGVNFPGVRLSARTMTQKDLADLRLGQDLGVDYVAASFVKSAADISRVRAELDDRLGTRVIAKVERVEAIENLEELVRAADGVMVARGDMGVELPPEEVPVVQKTMLRMAALVGTLGVTATQMLESMIENPRPTRAEVTDVFNAILDGTTAVMLSGESAVGKYPAEAVRTMANIAERAETFLFAEDELVQRTRPSAGAGPEDAVAHAAVTMSQDLRAKAIVVITRSGATARAVSMFRPEVPVLSATPDARTRDRLALQWGCVPMLVPEAKDRAALIAGAEKAALATGLVGDGDVVVVTSGRIEAGAGGTRSAGVGRIGRLAESL